MLTIKECVTRLRKQSFPQVELSDSLSHVSAQIAHSHVPVLVYNKSAFVGIINPRKIVFKKLKVQTLISRIVSKPRYFTADARIEDVVEFMSESHLYTVPIFDKDQKLVGLVTAKSILAYLIEHEAIMQQLEAVSPVKPVICVPHTLSVSKVVSTLKQENISRLYVTKDEKLYGVITKRDLLVHFISLPKRPNVGKPTTTGKTLKVAEDKSVHDAPIFPLVHKLKEIHKYETYRDILEALLSSKYNSLVTASKDGKPAGILTISDLLLSASHLIKKNPYIYALNLDFLASVEGPRRQTAFEHFLTFAAWVDKLSPIQSVHLSVKETHLRDAKPKVFEVHSRVETDGGVYFAKARHKVFVRATIELIDRLKSQITKDKDKQKRAQIR